MPTCHKEYKPPYNEFPYGDARRVNWLGTCHFCGTDLVMRLEPYYSNHRTLILKEYRKSKVAVPHFDCCTECCEEREHKGEFL